MSVACGLLLALAAAPLQPTTGVSASLRQQALSSPGASSRSEPSLLLALTGGLRYPVGDAVELNSHVGLGVGTADLHLVLVVEQQAAWGLALPGQLRLTLGVSVAAQLDLARPAFSALAVSPVVGLRWRRVELTWLPGVQLPLAGERRQATGVTLTRAMAVMWLPLNLGLRVALGP